MSCICKVVSPQDCFVVLNLGWMNRSHSATCWCLVAFALCTGWVILFIWCECESIVRSLWLWMGPRVTSTAATSKVRVFSVCVFVCVKTVWRHSNIFSCCPSCKRDVITHSELSVFLCLSFLSLLSPLVYILSYFAFFLSNDRRSWEFELPFPLLCAG